MAGLDPRVRALLRQYRQGKRASLALRDATWSQIESSLEATDEAPADLGDPGDPDAPDAPDAPTQPRRSARPVAWAVGVASPRPCS